MRGSHWQLAIAASQQPARTIYSRRREVGKERGLSRVTQYLRSPMSPSVVGTGREEEGLWMHTNVPKALTGDWSDLEET